MQEYRPDAFVVDSDFFGAEAQAAGLSRLTRWNRPVIEQKGRPTFDRGLLLQRLKQFFQNPLQS